MDNVIGCIEDMIKCLSMTLKTEFEKGMKNVHTEEAGEVADILKDLTEARYYLTVVDAMHSGQSVPLVSNRITM